MDLQHAFSKLEADESYTTFKAAQPDAFLAHCFVSIEQGKKSDWQIGFFNEKSGKVIQFEIKESEVVKKEEDEMMDKERKVYPLDQTQVKHEIEEVMEECSSIIFEQLKAPPMKTFVILASEEDKAVYNLNALSRDLRVLTIKVDAQTKEVMSKKLTQMGMMS